MARVKVGGVNPGSQPPSRDDWDRALEAWRGTPTIAHVAAELGIGFHRARTIVEVGIPAMGLPPVKKVLEEESRLAAMGEKRLEGLEAKSAARVIETRTKALARSEASRVAILGDAAAQHAEEAKLVRMNRQGAVALAAVNGRLLSGALSLVEALEKDLAENKGTIKERLGYLRTIANVVARTAEASQKAVQMERLIMGEPTAILGVQGGKPNPDDMTPDEAGQWLEAGMKAFEKAKRRRAMIEAKAVEVVDHELLEDEAAE
jgi:hypothetical protein